MLAVLLLHIQNHIHVIPLLPVIHLGTTPTASCNAQQNNGLQDIDTVVKKIAGALTYLGAGVCGLGIAVGGIMRATSFGNERRVSDSNTAITCAVVGLIVVVLAQAIANWLNGFIIC